MSAYSAWAAHLPKVAVYVLQSCLMFKLTLSPPPPLYQFRNYTRIAGKSSIEPAVQRFGFILL